MELKDLPYFFTLSKHEQKGALEALLFTSDEPQSLRVIMKILATSGDKDKDKAEQSEIELEMLDKIGFNENYVEGLIEEINQSHSENDRPYRIVNHGGGFSIITSRKYGKIVSKINKNIVRKKLTNANLETLAIIAYRQPISRPGVDSIRGVNSKDIINSLVDKKYVKIVGKSDAPGSPYLYGTTNEFLKSFGLNSLDDLPKLKELKELAEEERSTEDFTLKVDFEEEQPNLGEQSEVSSN